jgi:hypothetical protein
MQVKTTRIDIFNGSGSLIALRFIWTGNNTFDNLQRGGAVALTENLKAFH